MSELNPDFRTVDEVAVPEDIQESGWGRGDDERTLVGIEQRLGDKLEADNEQVFRNHTTTKPLPKMLEKWNAFQRSKGRYDGSNDLSLLDEFVHGAPLVFHRQIIGSCVISNTFRPWVARAMWQVAIQGQPQEYFGRDEFGPNSYAPFAPQSYGMARKRANMRGGDGLYCAPMAESLMQDGVLMCKTPALVQLMSERGFSSASDFPEPQGNDGARLYRQFGDWDYIERFRGNLCCKLLESERVKTADQLWRLLQEGKPSFVCSMEAIHKVGTHPDGFPIHARNPRDRWAHNMSFHGVFTASDGERFFRQCNQSWGENHIYNRKFEEVASSFRSGRLTVQAIGQIAIPPAAPPAIG